MKFIALLLMLGFVSPGLVSAASITNSFDSDAEGWVANVPEGALTYSTLAGNPGGYIRLTDTGGSSVNGFASGAFFGADFIGDLSAFDGGSLSFDLRAFAGGGPTFSSFGRVMLYRTGDANPADQTFEAAADIVANATASWVSYTLNFDALTFGVTQVAWNDLLGNIAAIGIATDAFDGADTIGIDNVALESPTVPPAVPLPAGWILGLTAFFITAALKRTSAS